MEMGFLFFLPSLSERCLMVFFAMPHHRETERVATKSFQLGLLPDACTVVVVLPPSSSGQRH